MRISILPIVAILLLAPVVPALAQPSLDVTLGRALAPISSGLADVASTTNSETSRQITAASIDLEHRAADEQVRLFYSLDAGTYNTAGDWSYSLHTAGGTWRSTRPGSTRPTIFAGGTASWRSNGVSWEAANYHAVGAFANLEWRPRPTATVRTGYRVDARTFPDSPELDQREHGLFGSVLVNLPTRTTLITEVRAGLKSYATSGWQPVPVYASDYAMGSAGAAGRGRGMGAASHLTTTPPPASTSAQPRDLDPAQLVSVMGRIAQSLTDRTGVSAQYTRRQSFGGVPTAIVTTPALFFEDGVYDDPYASDAHALRTTVKHLFSSGAEVEGGGTWLLKDYRATPALAADGSVNAAAGLRDDRIWRAGASWVQPVLGSRTGPVGLNVLVDYWFTRHQSNDAFYNYSSHSLGLGVRVVY